MKNRDCGCFGGCRVPVILREKERSRRGELSFAGTFAYGVEGVGGSGPIARADCGRLRAMRVREWGGECRGGPEIRKGEIRRRLSGLGRETGGAARRAGR